jgi:hypothetical protein
MTFIYKNDARFLAWLVALFQEFVDTPVNGISFHIDSIYQMETSISHASLVY